MRVSTMDPLELPKETLKQNNTLLDLEQDTAVLRFQAAVPINKMIKGNRPWRSAGF
jgi:hypothetical protein